jgi:SEC-C motif domain protein
MKNTCPCGSSKPYSNCCEPYHLGALPETAVLLMRSRYSAFVKQNADYLINTLHPLSAQPGADRQGILDTFASCEWLDLRIISTSAGSANDTQGYVEFIATYRESQVTQQHQENSFFEKIGPKWYYRDSR